MKPLLSGEMEDTTRHGDFARDMDLNAFIEKD